MLAEAWDHARCSGNCALINLVLLILDFEAFLQNRQQTTIKSVKTDNFAYLGALGLLKTAPACIFHHIRSGKINISINFYHLDHC